MTIDLSRRAFLGASVAAAAGLAARRPNDKVLVGMIGCGNIAREHLESFKQMPEVEIAALCDIDSERLDPFARAVERHYSKPPKTFRDFRRLLEMKELDAVSVGSPDHWHALHLVHAVQAGKDVYCEKPVSHNVAEGRAMVEWTRRTGRVVQIGTQQRSNPHYRDVIALIRGGGLGKISEVQTWNLYNQGGIGAPPDAEPPATADYDLWLGPAPKRPFNENRFHGRFRYFFDYAGGYVCDWNVHHQDVVHLAMDAWSPRSAAMFGHVANENDNREWPETLKAVCEYDAPQGRFTSTYTVRRNNTLAPDGSARGYGIAFHGKKGTLVVTRAGWEILPEKGEAGRKETAKFSMVPHVRNFIDCVKSRAKPASDIESMHLTTAACHLANIAWRVGRRVHWDAKAERCFRDPELRVPDGEADRWLSRDNRAPWKLPG